MRRSGAARVIYALTLSGVWSLEPREAHAAPAPTPETDAAKTESPMQEAQRLHESARAHYETLDFARAIELWTRAYEVVGSAPEDAGIRNAIVFNLASARIKQYDIDEDTQQLKKARGLLERYMSDLEGQEGEEYAEERRRVQARLDEIADRLGDREESAVVVPSQANQGTSAPVERVDHGPKPGRGMIIGGGVVLGAGVAAGASLLGAGLGMGSQAQRDGEDASTPAGDLAGLEARGRTGNSLAIAGAVVGSTLIVTGVALLVTGVLKKKRGGREAAFRVEPGMSFRF